MKILLAVDGSSYSDAAVAEVCRRPWPSQSEVRLITVYSPMNADSFSASSSGIFEEINKQLRAEALNRLDDATIAFSQNAPALPFTSVLLEGWPKDEILQEAERWEADLIVVGSHGKGGIQRLFLGSVSLAVATGAQCSVEIVRAPRSRPSDSPPTSS